MTVISLADEQIARRNFSPNEVNTLISLPPGLRKQAFYNCWTRKEAYIKAHGEGLSMPLDQFDVTLIPGQPAALIGTRPEALEASRWDIQALEIDDDFAAAIAVKAHKLHLLMWQWTESGINNSQFPVA